MKNIKMILAPKRAKIIGKILQGDNDERIARYLRVPIHIVKGFYNKGLLPKRKSITSYVIKEYLTQVKSFFGGSVRISSIVKFLNADSIPNQCGNDWSYGSLRSFLQRNGFPVRQERVDTGSFVGNTLDFYEAFSVCRERLDFEKQIKQMKFEDRSVSTGLSQHWHDLEVGIRASITGGAKTGSDITKYLNANGYRNKSNKEFGRWSVNVALEKLGIEIPLEKVEWGKAESLHLIERLNSIPKTEKVTTLMLWNWARELDTEKKHIADKIGLIQSVSHIRTSHNKTLREQVFYDEWFPKIAYAVNVTFRHKSASRIELSEHFNTSAMAIQRYITRLDYNVTVQYYLRFKILYTSYLEQTMGETWSATKCATWFNNTYLQTERGSSWTYACTQFSIDKLHKLEDMGCYGLLSF